MGRNISLPPPEILDRYFQVNEKLKTRLQWKWRVPADFDGMEYQCLSWNSKHARRKAGTLAKDGKYYQVKFQGRFYRCEDIVAAILKFRHDLVMVSDTAGIPLHRRNSRGRFIKRFPKELERKAWEYGRECA